MIRVIRRLLRWSGTRAASTPLRPAPASTPSVEGLEGRTLLSLYLGPSKNRPIVADRALYQVTLTGPGLETINQVGAGKNRGYAINLTGTTSQSQLSITLKSAYPGFGTSSGQLPIAKINVQSGQIGVISALGTANLLGDITTLQGDVQTLAFNDLGPNAQINVAGSVGTFEVNNADLGPNGLVHITGNSTGTFSAGQLDLDGGKALIDGAVTGGLELGSLTVQQSGQFLIGGAVTAASTVGSAEVNGGRVLVGQDVSAPLTVGTLDVSNAGQFIVGGNLSGGLQLTGAATVSDNGLFQIGGNLASLNVTQDLDVESSGQFLIGQDVTGPVAIGSGISLSGNGQFSIGRDLLGGMTVNGNFSLDSGGSFSVGRDLDTLSINGNLTFTPSAGTFDVGGNLNTLTINGIYQGRGELGMSSPELIVGSDLNNFTVLGTQAGVGSVSDANIAVTKSIVGFNIAHGIFNSLITAGVLIENGTVGPDGTDAVFDSQIMAGLEINTLEINGNVHSDYVTNPNPTGLPTRIIAGEDREGNWVNDALIDNFQITGALMDSVIAASVQPNGGDGTLPPTGYGASRSQSSTPGDGGNDTYDAPAGVIAGGTFSNPIDYPNYSELSYFNETLTGVSWNTALDPTIDDNILGGAINPSFASPPASADQVSTVTTTGSSTSTTSTVTSNNLALPTESTVLGGVISTSHGSNPDAYDFAGIFAANTSGIFVGTLPQSSPGT